MPNPRGGEGELFRAWLTQQLEKYKDPVDSKYNGLMGNPDFLWACYELIKSKPGNMSHGIDNTTLDGLTDSWFHNLASNLIKGRFKFTPARRVMKPKPKGEGEKEKRPLGVGSPREKIAQKALQVVLEAIWEPIYHSTSHGFRPRKSIHTALKSVYLNGSRFPWVVQGDISKCFDMIPHTKTLCKRVEEVIKCQRTPPG